MTVLRFTLTRNLENFLIKRHESLTIRSSVIYSMCTRHMFTRNFKEQISIIKRQDYMENTARGDTETRLFAVPTIRVGKSKVTSKFCHQVASSASGKLFREVVGAFVFYD